MNSDLTLSQAYSLWEEDTPTLSLSTHKTKILKMVKEYGQYDAREILTEEKLRKFIFVHDKQSAFHRRNAFVSFCTFVYKNLLHEENYIFPISIKSVEEFDRDRTIDRKRVTYDVNYFPVSFDLGELLDDKYYEHIEEPTAIITLKAIISLYLSIPIGKELLLKGKSSTTYIRLSDISCVDSQEVVVKLRDKNSFSKEVHIISDSAKYIIEYYNIRVNKNVDTDEFFIKMWSGGFKFDSSITAYYPGGLHQFILYILKYICVKNGFDNVTIDSLRNNVILNWLINSKGTALNEIVSICGYQPFVINSFKKYKSICVDTCYSFDFFNIASSSEENKEKDGEAISTSIIHRRKRDSQIVIALKQQYQYYCQICGTRIEIGNKLYYSEAHHIQPLGAEHHGPDNIGNLINLCPNHHAMFDMGIIAIDPADKETIIHIDKNNSLYGLKVTKKHEFSGAYLRYHYKNIFLRTKKMVDYSKVH